MLFYPYGQRKGEVADPKNLSREYQNALRLVQRTTHYQWGENAASTYSSSDKVITVTTTEVNVDLGSTGNGGQAGTPPQLK